MFKKIGLLIVLAIVLMALPAYSATFNLSWTDNSNNEDGFKIERRLGQTGTFAPISNSPTIIDATTAIDITPDNQEYCYRVRAFTLAGDSGYSNVACGTPVVITIPNAPGGMTTVVLPVIIIIPITIPIITP